MSKQDAVVVGERDTHIAQNLRQARETLGLTQPDLATRMERLGHPFSQATISRIESGNRRVTLPEAADLATLLHITLDTFLDPPGNPTAVAQRRALRDHATELEATLTELAHTLTRAITAQIALLDAIAIISEFTPEDSVAPFTRTEADALITQYGPLTATRTLTDIQTTLHHAAQHAPWDTFTRFQDALEPTPDFLDHYGVRNDFINAWKPLLPSQP